MLDQLIESKSNSRENTRRSGFFATTFVVLITVLLGTLVYSLFAKDYGMDSGDLELSALVAPVPVPEEEPPPPPEKQPEVKEAKAAPNADTRTEIIQAVNESPKVPDKISDVKQTIPPRDVNKKTVLGTTNNSFADSAPSNYAGPVSTNGKGAAGPGGVPNSGNKEGAAGVPAPPPPPPAPPKPTPTPAPPAAVPKSISKGVITGNAISLPKPAYPAAARAVRASGAVSVQVTVSESGSVISASAVSGSPLLRQVAEQAARSAKFAPTLLSGQPVKVTGIIIYNFTP